MKAEMALAREAGTDRDLSHADLRDAMNVAIAEMLRDGTYKRIEAKYFSFDMYGK